MPANTDTISQMALLFEQQPCWTIKPLSEQLQYSIPSIRRFLSQVGYFSSFTHNGVWYTLQSIPQFNRKGLWFYQDIGFSKAGTLPRTIIDLVNRSHSGLSAEQIGKDLRCRCHSLLVNLCRQQKLQRQKIGRSHIYFTTDLQMTNRKHQTIQKPPVGQLPAEIAVLILVEFIKRPDADFKQLAQTISAKGVTVQTVQIEKLFEQHGLKKKT